MSGRLERRDPGRNVWRWYRAYLCRTLFGDWAVIREYGRIGDVGGQRIETWHETEEAARRSLEAVGRSKRRRGYGPADDPGEGP